MRTEDGQIIYRCLNGDAAAFGLLVDKYKASIYALAYSKLGNFHDAEDVTQEVFIKAFRKLRTLRWWDSFRAWLYAITSNLCKDWIRSRSSRPDGEFVADQKRDVLDQQSVESYREASLRESIRETMDSLPEKYRQVLILYYFGGMKRSEIAGFLGVSIRTIGDRLMKGRARLKEEMIEMMSEVYQQKRLSETFTFRIVEMVKRMRIQSVPRMNWLPWGISVTFGAIIALLSLTSSIAPLVPGHMVFSMPDGSEATFLQNRSDIHNSHFSKRGKADENLRYINVPVSLEDVGNNPSLSVKPTEITPTGQVDGQVDSSEQPPLMTSASALGASIHSEVVVFGHVVADETPVPDAQVSVYQFPPSQDTVMEYETRTRNDGSFQLEILEPKQWELSRSDGGKWKLLVAVATHPQHSFGWTRFSKEDIADVTIRLHQPAAIDGIVTNQDGIPIEGAKAQIEMVSFVEIDDPSTGTLTGGAIPSQIAETDSSGMFAFTNLPEASSVFLRITAAGYAQMTASGIQAGMEELPFSLKPEGRVEGTLTFGDSGEPVSGMTIAVHAAYPGTARAEAQTAEDGSYTLAGLPTGDYSVVVKNPPQDRIAVPQGRVTVLEGTVEKLDLQLIIGGFITGRVTDRDTNEPIEGHYINLSQNESLTTVAITDETGFYRLQAAPGKATLYTHAPKGYESVEREVGRQVQKRVDVIEGGTTANVDFQFRKSELLSLTGRVLTADGEPVEGAVISDRLERGRYYDTSDRRGNFTISEISAGQKLSLEAQNVQAQLRGYADVEAQRDLDVVMLVERYETTSVSGRVVDERSEPVPSANVILIRFDRDLRRGVLSPAGLTDDLGRYSMAGLIVGDEYQILARKKGHKEVRTRRFEAMPAMSPLEDIVFFPPGRFFLAGKVTDADGNPVPNARIRSRSIQPGVRTDMNGHYRLDNLSNAVEVELTVSHPDYGTTMFLYVPTNQTRDFRLVKANRYLSGKVLDADGNPVENARLEVFVDDDQQASGHIEPVDMTDRRGRFRLDHILGDSVSIYVGKGEIHRIFDDVKTNQNDVTFRLEEKSEPPTPAEEAAKRGHTEGAILTDEQAKRRMRMRGKPAPELDVAHWLNEELVTTWIRSTPIKLSDVKGMVVILHFWECENARSVEGIGFLNALQEEYSERGMVCIGIHRFTTQIEGVKQLIEDKGAEYHIAIDKKSPLPEAKGLTFERYGVSSQDFIVIDRQGVVHGRILDYKLEEAVQELLSHKF